MYSEMSSDNRIHVSTGYPSIVSVGDIFTLNIGHGSGIVDFLGARILGDIGINSGKIGIGVGSSDSNHGRAYGGGIHLSAMRVYNDYVFSLDKNRTYYGIDADLYFYFRISGGIYYDFENKKAIPGLTLGLTF